MLGNRGLQPERQSYDQWRADLRDRITNAAGLSAINAWRRARRLPQLSELPKKG
jgi:hypothetical protein